MTEEKKMANTPVEVDDLYEEKVLLEWEAPERSYKKRDKDFWVTAVSILVLVAVILFFIKEFFLIIALGSILFLYYVMSTVPPEKVLIKITNRAVYFGEASYPWTILEKFWFGTSLNSTMINFGTLLKFPRAIAIVINPKDKDKIKEIVVKRIPMIESSPTLIDKITKYVGNKLPLEDREEGKK
ncbi:hypothetical protein KBC75_02110 [Candidatus Shapirobacteria bacterium]|nr:hypothetical protein [Candidatus Shapirobacteria bacterium]